MNGEARHEDGPHTQTPPITVAVAPDGLGETAADIDLLPLPDETEGEWRRRLAARGVRLVPGPVREGRRQALAALARLHGPAVTLDRCAVAGDGTLVVYERPALQPGARRHRTFTPEIVRGQLASATRPALQDAGLLCATRSVSPRRDREARPSSRGRRPGQPPPSRGDPSPGPSRRRRGATLQLLLDALVRESSVWAGVERPARAAWEVAQ